MEKGFYRINNAVRWGGYASSGSGGFFTSDVSPMNEFDGKIGFIDPRLVEMRGNGRDKTHSTTHAGSSYSGVMGVSGMFGSIECGKAPYNIPIIFRGEVFSPRRSQRGWVASFFKKEEISRISDEEAIKNLGTMVARRYGDIEFMAANEPEYSGLVLSDPFKENTEQTIEGIPIYLPFVRKREVQRLIVSDRRTARELYEHDRRQARAWSEIGHRPVCG